MQPIISSAYVRTIGALSAMLIVALYLVGSNAALAALALQPLVGGVAALVFLHFLVGLLFVARRSFVTLRREERAYLEVVAPTRLTDPTKAKSEVAQMFSRVHQASPSIMCDSLARLEQAVAVQIAHGSRRTIDREEFIASWHERVQRKVCKPIALWSRQLFLLGIIFTFIGFAIALWNPIVPTGVEEMRSFVNAALSGFGVALMSSIVAYCGGFCLTTIVNHSFEHSIDELRDRFDEVMFSPVFIMIHADIDAAPVQT